MSQSVAQEDNKKTHPTAISSHSKILFDDMGLLSLPLKKEGRKALLLLSPILVVLCAISPAVSFSPISSPHQTRTRSLATATILAMDNDKNKNEDNKNNMGHHPFCDLPGDPSLILTTNVDLGDKKLEIMKAVSKAIVASTGKPESYVAVSINDKADVIFGGSDAPTALGVMYSIGAIGMENNGKLTKAVTEILFDFGVEPNRIYINFFDMPRANVGWSERTFAG